MTLTTQVQVNTITILILWENATWQHSSLSIIPSDRELGDWSNFQTLIYSNQSTVTEQLESGWHSVTDIIYIRPFYSWSLTFKGKSGSTPMWTTEQQMKEHLNYWRRFNPVSQGSPLSQKLSQWMRGAAPPIYLEIRVTPEEAEQGRSPPLQPLSILSLQIP